MTEKNYVSNLTQTEIVFYGLLYEPDVCGQVISYISPSYMPEKSQTHVFKLTNAYFKKYNKPPTAQELKVAIQNSNMSDEDFDESLELVNSLELFDQNKKGTLDTRWLVDETEKWCRSRAYHNVVMESISAIDSGKNPSEMGIAKKMEEALAISFDSSVGHNLFEDSEARYESYHNVEERVPFILSKFNEITKGGLEKKTLSCFLSNRTGGFKSGTMCHMACDNMRLGKNVLYLTAEMGEFKIGERIDANLLDVSIDDIPDIPKPVFLKKLQAFKEKYTGELVIKEYPTSSAHAGHVRYILKELRRKRGFIPDIVYFDYLNIFASEHLPGSARQNSYLWVKSIAEEFRALAQEFNFAGVTATQSNRGGTGSSDLDLTDTSESIGLPNILDLFMAIIRTEELDENGEIMFKQLKNRYRDENLSRIFTCGVDKGKMKLWDAKSSSEEQYQERANVTEEEFGLNNKTGKKRPGSFDDFAFD